MSRPRVVLVEDDVTIRAWVAMALEELAIDLVCCTTLDEARQCLRRAGQAPALLLQDLMLPDGNGLDLLTEVQTWPAAQRPAHIVLLSASPHLPKAPQQTQWGLDEILPKPVALDRLITCVERWTGLGDAMREGPGTPDAAAAASPPVQDVIERLFGGDAALYRAFHTRSLAQFRQDLASADGALQAGDMAGMRRVAHNLKSVLTLLGHARLATLAAQLEAQAQHPAPGDTAHVAALWSELRSGLQSLTRTA
jgi:CheY-like chemotaxis protein